MVTKEEILQEIISHYQNERETLESIAEETKKGTTGDEVKQEGKYDTRAIEAGYLAGAQARRVEETKLNLTKARSFKILQNNGSVSVGSLLKLRDLDEKELMYFISPTESGFYSKKLKLHIISYNSPIAQEAINLSTGDTFEVIIPSGTKEFEIIEIL
ncbi:MAG: GreA/GreB family elongation factor [Bacteriovoracaceae bacterium]